MYTRPSIDDLLEGARLTIENSLLPGMDASPDVQRATLPILTVLDRVAREWSVKTQQLAGDTRSLIKLIKQVATIVADLPEGPRVASIAQRQPKASAKTDARSLAAANGAVKEAVIQVMAILDLPAAADADDARREADRVLRSGLIAHADRELDAIPLLEVSEVQSRMNQTMGAEPIGDLPERLTAFLTAELGAEAAAGSIVVHDFRPLDGGASRDTYLFDMSYTDAAGAPQHDSYVLQREAVSSLLDTDPIDEPMVATRRQPHNEFHVVREMERAGIRVPKMLWCDRTGEWMERPFIISKREPGITSDRELRAGDPAALAAVYDDFVTSIAGIHDLDPADYDLGILGHATKESVAGQQLATWERSFRMHALEPHPGIEYLLRWLKANLPVASELSVIHGDYRRGNFLIDGDRVSAYIDWEQVHLGDPIEEIAFIYWAHWSLEPIMSLDDFLAKYEQARGITVDREILAFYRLFLEFKMLVVGIIGLNSFFATADRQLQYTSPYSHTFITECYHRALRELDTGGPRYDFPAAQGQTVLY